MSDDLNNCSNCEHLTKNGNDKDHCSFYDHEPIPPRDPCPGYDKKKKFKIFDKKPPKVMDASSRKQYDLFFIISFLSWIILSVMVFIYTFVFSINLSVVTKIPFLCKLITIVIDVIIALAISYFLFIISKRYKPVRIIEIVLTLVFLLYVLFNFKTVMYNTNTIIIKTIDALISLFR